MLQKNIIEFFKFFSFCFTNNILPQHVVFLFKKKQPKLIRANQSSISLNRYLLSARFKPLSLFRLAHSNENQILRTKNTFIKVLSFVEIFKKKQFILNQTYHFLVGTKIPLTTSELKRKKKWMALRPKFFIKKRKKWYKLEKKKFNKNLFFRGFFSLLNLPKKTSKKKLKKFVDVRKNSKKLLPSFYDTQLKVFYLNKLFFFSKLKITYKQAKLVLRRLKLTYPKHWTVFKFKHPYTFLRGDYQNVKKIRTPINSIFKKYKIYKKFFRTTRRLSYRKRRKAFLYFIRFSKFVKMTKIFKKKLRKFKFLRKMRPLAFKSLKPNTPNIVLVKEALFFDNGLLLLNKTRKKISNRFWFFKRKLVTKALSSFFVKKKQLARYIKHWSWFKFKYRIRGCVKTKLFFKYRRRRVLISYKRALFLRSFAKICSLWPKTNCIRNPISTTPLTLIFCANKASLYKTKLNLSFFLANKFIKPFQHTSNSDKISNPKSKLLLLPDHDLVFFLEHAGFLLLTHILPISYLSATRKNSYKVRKIQYSFSRRDDLPKHILKKYTYNKVSLSLTRYFYTQRNFLSPYTYPFIQTNYKQQLQEHSNPDLYMTTKCDLISISSPYVDSFSLSRFYFQNRNWTYQSKHSIFQIKYKPGYMRIWRTARAVLKIRNGFKFTYQHELTHYLNAYKRSFHLEKIFLSEMKLQNILVRSRLILDLNIIKICVGQNLVSINGFFYTNTETHVYINDFIQLIVSFKYYITFRWLLNKSMKLKTRIINLSKKLKAKRKLQHPDKKYNKNKPLWLSLHFYLFLDIAKYMEVDFFTLSIFIIRDPLFWQDINPYHEIVYKTGIYNMYNWKYIT